MLALQDCQLIIKKYLNSEDFEVLSHKTSENESNNTCLIDIKISTESGHLEVRFIGIQLLTFPLFQLRQNLSEEVLSYQTVLENRNFDEEWAPTYCTNNNLLVILVDLFKQQFRLPQNSFILDVNRIRIVLENLAKHHANFISFEEAKSKELGLVQGQNLTNNELMETPWFKARLNTLNALIDLLPQNELITHQKFKEQLATIAVTTDEVKAFNKTCRKTLCHYYTGGDSIFFKYNDGKPVGCKLLNLEIPHYNSPAYDVLQLIYMATTTEIRKKHFHELLEFYYDAFKSHLSSKNLEAEKILPLEEEFEIAVKYLLPLIKLQTACFRQVQHLPQAFFEQIKADVFKDATPHIVDAFKTNESYRILITEHLHELRDLIIHPGLTTEDCFQIVRNKIGTADYKLLNYELLPIANVSGFFGDHRKLKIDISVESQKQTIDLFVKFTPKGKAQKSIADDCSSFFKEIFFYRHFIPINKKFKIDVINECTVPCYFTRQNDVIVFEDFAIRKYGVLNPRQPLPYDTVQLVVRQLAKFHASSIIAEEKLSEELKTKFSFKDHYERGLQESFFTKVGNHQGAKSMEISVDALEYQINLFSDLKATMLTEDFKVKIQKAYERVYELVKPSTEFRNAICHGDLWVSNILVQKIDDKLEDCRLVDFQIMRYCPPAHDLLGFIYLTTNRSFRKQYLNNVIKLYHSELTKILKNYGYDPDSIYSFDNFMKSIEYMLPQAVCQTVIYYHICVGDPNLLKDYLASEQMIRQIFLEDRREFIEEMCNKDPLYRERSKESLEDLRDMCLKYF